MQEAINHAKLAMLFRQEFQLCNVQKGETIVLLSDLGARREGHQVVALACAVEEHAVGVRHEHGPVAARAHPHDGQEDLLLSAAPGAGGVEVECEHSSHSLANLSST